MFVDWGEYCEKPPYKIGLIFFAILNLPAEIRYKQGNVILGGIIPGPAEPQLVINSYLEPINHRGVEFTLSKTIDEVKL